jgi:hypothetical protein
VDRGAAGTARHGTAAQAGHGAARRGAALRGTARHGKSRVPRPVPVPAMPGLLGTMATERKKGWERGHVRPAAKKNGVPGSHVCPLPRAHVGRWVFRCPRASVLCTALAKSQGTKSWLPAGRAAGSSQNCSREPEMPCPRTDRHVCKFARMPPG